MSHSAHHKETCIVSKIAFIICTTIHETSRSFFISGEYGILWTYPLLSIFMDSEDKDKQPQVPGAPGSLPVVEQKTFLTHTMEDDVQKAKGQGYVPERKAAEKPFTRNIPPPAPPVPPAQNDPFRESIGEKPFERDQPFPIAGNAPEAPDTEKKFQIYVPKKKRGPNALTLMLIVVLVLLLSGGGFAYYWFFMKEAAPAPAQITPPPTPEPVPTQPVPETDQAPEPQPQPQPA